MVLLRRCSLRNSAVSFQEIQELERRRASGEISLVSLRGRGRARARTRARGRGRGAGTGRLNGLTVGPSTTPASHELLLSPENGDSKSPKRGNKARMYTNPVPRKLLGTIDLFGCAFSW